MEYFAKHIHCNRARLTGTVAQEPRFSHANHGNAFRRFLLSVPRLSGQCDLLPILLPETLADSAPLTEGQRITVTGQLRSFNNRSGEGPRLVISLLGRSLAAAQGPDCNTIALSGTLCKTPTLRRTPLGREICDMLLAVNRRYGRADYLPCIAWGAVAEQAALLQVGDPFSLEGRIQSRTYAKALGEETVERTAYEVSVMRPVPPQELLQNFF